jgi:hypothetical protein
VTEPFSGRAIPNYREIDRDPRWHPFLREIDPYTGQQRQALLNIAINDGSAARIIAMFNGFLQEAGDTQQSPPTRGQAAGRRSGKPIYSRDDIKRMYEQHRQNAWTGREAEWQRLEYEIIRAGAEGRIVGGVDVAGK